MKVGELAVINDRLVTPVGIIPGGILSSRGRISALLAREIQPKASLLTDARGHYILRGIIDAHVHMRTPGLTHKDDWLHGSRAAAAGGVTTVIDMPNTEPPFL